GLCAFCAFSWPSSLQSPGKGRARPPGAPGFAKQVFPRVHRLARRSIPARNPQIILFLIILLHHGVDFIAGFRDTDV
ncbi:hypothetical protein, partial [Pontiella sp.]|uniref:hypothetical protein n=1 Tax=Pontiella sp. TaxID=2837462 RepID=UPI0035699A58